MQRSLLTRILRPAAAALLLAASATSHAATAEPAPTGWIVVSLSLDRGISTVALVLQARAARTPGESKAAGDSKPARDPKGLNGLNALTGDSKAPRALSASSTSKGPKLEAAFSLDPPPGDLQNWEGRSGAVRVLKVPAGTYSLVNFRLEQAEPKGRWFARDNYDIRFSVKEGEVTYLGEFQGTQFLNKLPAATAAAPSFAMQSYFIVQDQKGRDLALAEAANPEIRGKPVTSIAPVKAKGKSHFQASRLPDKK
jgi:hypothetical protein